MRRVVWLTIFLLAICPAGWAGPFGLRTNRKLALHRVNCGLCGQLIDFTQNHGCDRRIHSAALCARRDLYVYLPPGYDPNKQYPGLLYLHGITQDETGFLKLVPNLDRAIKCGELPPMIVAAPDGTTRGDNSVFSSGSFYVNSKAGRFEDYIVNDVWQFVCANFPIRPERDNHILVGASMGGFGAYNLAIKHRDQFRVVAGIMPPLHTRYLDCHGRYFADYDPECLGMRERVMPLRPIGRFSGVIVIRERKISKPLYGRLNPDAIDCIAAENPYEMLDSYCVKPGELDMFVGYGKKDNFNLDAQAEAFIDKARCMGLEITCVVDPCGKHNTATGERLFPDFCRWLTQILSTRTTIESKN